MTAGTGAAAEQPRSVFQAIAALDMDAGQLRMMSAVHESGHAIAAGTVGFTVAQARAGDPATTRCGVEVDLSCYAGETIPLPDLLAMKAAGYQAAFIWLQDGGGHALPYDFALKTLAGDDISWCLDICGQLLRPDLSMQDGIEGAWRILTCRWGAVLHLAEALAGRGVLAGADLLPYLTADPVQHAEAVGSYRAWRRRTSELWRQQPGKPAEVWLREPAGRNETGDPPAAG